jgi:hypothetical protein
VRSSKKPGANIGTVSQDNVDDVDLGEKKVSVPKPAKQEAEKPEAPMEPAEDLEPPVKATDS